MKICLFICIFIASWIIKGTARSSDASVSRCAARRLHHPVRAPTALPGEEAAACAPRTLRSRSRGTKWPSWWQVLSNSSKAGGGGTGGECSWKEGQRKLEVISPRASARVCCPPFFSYGESSTNEAAVLGRVLVTSGPLIPYLPLTSLSEPPSFGEHWVWQRL